jgi:Cysteine-rich CWC
MSKHEIKQCTRCNTSFECKAGDIRNCQCYGVLLSAEAEGYISKKYNDCLCNNCLQQLNNQYILFTEQTERYKQR